MKKIINNEGNETTTICNKLKMLAADGKMRMVDILDTKQLFTLIPSFSSSKKPFKLWLAKVPPEYYL